MKKNIMFPIDNKHEIDTKVKTIESIIGPKNIWKEGLDWNVPEVEIRCNKRQWKEIKFQLGLCKYYI